MTIVGSIGSVSREVTVADLASAWGRAFPPAASTPFVLGVAEVCCHEAVAHALTGGEITVGLGARIEHLAPSRLGATLAAEAVCTGQQSRRLTFEVSVRDGDTIVAKVEHRRAIVERARIEARLA